MTTSIVPGVVLKTRFITPDKKDFKNYIDYVDRKEVKNEKQLNQKMFSLYQDYMGDSEKTSSLFTENSNYLSEAEKKDLKKVFQKAQKNKSIMWQDVISFHNPWLEEHGIFDTKSDYLDEEKLMNVTRLAMKEMVKREKLDKSAIWSAAIHYNTDNIHVHIATVEPFPTRERGKRKPKTLDAMKSNVISNILERSEQHKQINDLIRKNMVNKKRENSTLKWRNREMKPLFLYIYNHLPKDKRQWQYSYNSLKPLKPTIDGLTKLYIEKYHEKEYKLFINKLDKEVEVLKKSYGEGSETKKRVENYKQHKIDELYKRMGNSFLKEMKDFDKNQLKIKKHLQKNSQGQYTYKQKISLLFALKKVQGAFKSEYESWKNINQYERLQNELERENERS